jgi:heme/copper-type cytochrome/quinol oxidase subunit 2
LWSSLFLDYSLHKNFNIGFASHKNDIHIHLSQWQYWWWFWFALVWALYFFLILKLYYNKTENYNITLNTSLRSHGKWGDFLVALIPLSWCGNILVNSNFILRMIEWQNESSLFTVRIQGKQWYWTYKYNSDTDFRLRNVYINVGNNNWVKTGNQSNVNFTQNNSLLSYIYEYEFKNSHKKVLKKFLRKKRHLLRSTEKANNNKYIDVSPQYDSSAIYNYNNNYYNSELKINDYSENSIFSNSEIILNRKKLPFFKKYIREIKIKRKKLLKTCKFEYFGKSNIFLTDCFKNLKYFENDQLENAEESAENVRLKNYKYPVRLIKGVLTKHNTLILNTSNSLNTNIILNYKLNNSDITEKLAQPEQFWGFRQKRYKKLRIFLFPNIKKYDNKTFDSIEQFSNNNDINRYNLYTGVKNNRYKNEMIPVTLARRLLRTRRTLVLPAHINLTLITNSYDVVHSWFVPGLGLKIDCVPGRSTHHSLYIDSIGFYYGQCAEICGRYHHHMPIRVCALSFEHFMLWWQTRGLPRMYRSASFQKSKSTLLHKFK